MQKPNFANKMFISVVGIFLLLAVVFLLFQYQRETEYKVDILNNKLQVINYQVGSTYPDTSTQLPENCRLTIITTDGDVLFDNEQEISQMGNHLNRKEIQQALKKGSGYDIQRHSETTDEAFFYSATLFEDKGVIVRSALPYDNQLYHDLAIDKTFIIVIVMISVILCIVLYQIARRLAESERQLVEHEKQQLKRQLTQNAAHELKTPTASISAYLETMLNDETLSEENRRHFLERSYAQCQRMSNILSDMSALAQMDSVQQVKEPLRINIRELLQNIADEVRLDLEKSQMTLDIPSDDLFIIGDRSLVYSIFRNLIDNAIAYAGQGKHISIKVIPTNGEMAEFVVSDNGVGVPEEHLPHLCERFYRIDKGRSRKLGGTGLGLAIVKNAILLHGGEITLSATPGGGLSVRFSLPLA